MAKKKMPSEHRISNMNDGDIQVISNDFGDYVLVKLAYKKGDYGYNFIDKEKIHNALNNHYSLLVQSFYYQHKILNSVYHQLFYILYLYF